MAASRSSVGPEGTSSRTSRIRLRSESREIQTSCESGTWRTSLGREGSAGQRAEERRGREEDVPRVEEVEGEFGGDGPAEESYGGIGADWWEVQERQFGGMLRDNEHGRDSR